MNSQREAKLKPCPFCGAPLEKRGNWDLYDHKANGCIMDLSTVSGSNLPEWNTRQAATEQGVGGPVGFVTECIGNKIGEGPVRAILNRKAAFTLPPDTKLYAHPPKPTDGDLTIDDYKEAFDSHRRMVRELDVLINGEEGAAKQASLCDLVGQIEKQGLAIPTRPTGVGVPGIRKLISEAMQETWDNWVCDTETVPTDIEIHGPRTTRVSFHASVWADDVGRFLENRLATQQPPEQDTPE